MTVDRQVSELVEGFPWALLADGSKVVDCGGGKGHASFILTKVYIPILSLSRSNYLLQIKG